jgi:hypothetical protein
MTTEEKVMERIAREAQRLAGLKARELRRSQRRAIRERREAARLEQERRAVFGNAVVCAGLASFEPDEIVGLLLDAKERMGESLTQRMAARKRGQEWMTELTQRELRPLLGPGL